MSGTPVIVFLLCTLLGLRIMVSVFAKERRKLAWRSKFSPKDVRT